MRVPAQLATLAPDNERRLRVDLQVREPVDDVDACLLELAGPADVPALVEASLQLDETDSLLSLLRGFDQRGHERRVTARAVHGRLQCEAVVVGRRSVDERLEARTERVVGLMNKNVALRHFGEELVRGSHVGEARMRKGEPRLFIEVGPVETDELRNALEIEQPLHEVDLVVADSEAPFEAVEHPGRSRTRDLDPYSVAEAPAPQLALDRLAEIVRLVRQLEVGVPADSEDAALEDLHLREETSEEVADHALERQKEPALADRHEPRQELRHLDARESFLAAVRIADEEPE